MKKPLLIAVLFCLSLTLTAKHAGATDEIETEFASFYGVSLSCNDCHTGNTSGNTFVAGWPTSVNDYFDSPLGIALNPTQSADIAIGMSAVEPDYAPTVLLVNRLRTVAGDAVKDVIPIDPGRTFSGATASLNSLGASWDVNQGTVAKTPGFNSATVTFINDAPTWSTRGDRRRANVLENGACSAANPDFTLTLSPVNSSGFDANGAATILANTVGFCFENIVPVPGAITKSIDVWESTSTATLADGGPATNVLTDFPADSDPDDNSATALQATLVTPPEASGFTLNADGSFTYLADAYSVRMTDSFQYKIQDSETGVSTQTVTVNITIIENNAGIHVTPTSGHTTTESGATAAFTVVLDSQPTADVSMDLSSADTSEGTVRPTSLTFTSGDWDTAQMVTVTGVDDSADDDDVVYTIDIGVASSGDANYQGLDPADVSVTNIDDDEAGITVSVISGNTTESGAIATFTVVLDSQPTADVSMGLSSADTTEGTVRPTSLTFTSGDWDTAQMVTVTGVDDSADDDDVVYTIDIGVASSGDANYQGLDPADVSVINSDDDEAGITVSVISGDTTESGAIATFTVVLDSQPTADVSMGLSSADTSEGTVTPTSLTFTSGDWDTAQMVTVTGVDDSVDDDDVVYTIDIGVASSGDANYQGLDPADVSVTNEDNEPEPGCSSPPVDVVLRTGFSTGYYLCVGDSRISTDPASSVVIQPGAIVDLDAPVVEFSSGFGVETGGVLSVITQP